MGEMGKVEGDEGKKRGEGEKRGEEEKEGGRDS